MRLLGFAILLAAGCAPSALERMDRLERRVRTAFARIVPEAIPHLWLAAADGREILAINPDRRVPAASTVKVLILVEAHAQVRAGRLRWTDEVTFLESDRVGGAGSLRNERAGSTWQYGRLARKMILESDNVASNLLLRRLGRDAVNARAASLGMRTTRLGRTFMERGARGENWTTAREMGDLMRRIYRREILTPGACDEMAALLERSPRGRIGAAVPRDVPVGRKGGTLPGFRHDVAWVELDGLPYVLAVFLENVYESRKPGEDRGVEAIEAVSNLVFLEMGPTEE